MALVPYFLVKNENDSLQERKAQLAPVQDTYNSYIAKQADYDYICALDEVIRNDNDKLPEIVGDLESKTPSEARVTHMTISEEGIIMDVVAPNKFNLARTLVEYRRLPYFAEVNTKGYEDQMNEGTGIIVTKYTIECVYGDNPYLSQPDEEEAAEENTEQPVSDDEVVEE